MTPQSNYSTKLILSLILCLVAIVSALLCTMFSGRNSGVQKTVESKSAIITGTPDTIKQVNTFSGSTVLKKKKRVEPADSSKTENVVFSGSLENQILNAEVEVSPISGDSLMILTYRGLTHTLLISRTDTVLNEYRTDFIEQESELLYFFAGGILTGIILLLLSIFISK